MWSDNIAERDYLGFDVHANLIKGLIETISNVRKGTYQDLWTMRESSGCLPPWKNIWRLNYEQRNCNPVQLFAAKVTVILPQILPPICHKSYRQFLLKDL